MADLDNDDPPPPPPSILAIKRDFLTTQTRILSQHPLAPSRTWRAANDADGSPPPSRLPGRAIEDSLFRANHALQQHCRRVWNPQATRHVAEQIDKLYWRAAEPEQDDDDDDETGAGSGAGNRALGAEADLTSEAVIASLPSPWPSRRQADASPANARQYVELVERLTALGERRKAALARVERLRRMRRLLEPFRAGGDGGGPDGEEDAAAAAGGVQENLVTRGGELERELERMKMLLARVGGRVALLPERGQVGEGDDADVVDLGAAQEAKIGAVLSGL